GGWGLGRGRERVRYGLRRTEVRDRDSRFAGVVGNAMLANRREIEEGIAAIMAPLHEADVLR
ncbi:hypothetical protein, partial [Mesorhizobium sp. WSM4312]|uniref:hypothetical protein n=1 Tax=Mesorhizobium sp. WSM4312 TaxID=2029411 RepID=UPI001AEC8AD7